MDTRTLLHDVADRAADWLDDLPERPVGPACTPAQMRVTATLGDDPVPVGDVVQQSPRVHRATLARGGRAVWAVAGATRRCRRRRRRRGRGAATAAR